MLHIFSRDVLQKIATGEEGWEELLPKGIAELIKEQGLFDYKPQNALNSKSGNDL